MTSFFAIVLIGQAPAHTDYYGVYCAGVKAGHCVVTESPDSVNGKPAVLQRSHLEMIQVMGGISMKASVDQETWFDAENHPLRENVVHRYPTGTVKAKAVYREKTVEVDIESSGKKSHKSVPIPKEELLGDSTRVIRDRLSPGKALSFASFSAEDGTFSTTTIKCVGPTTYLDGWRKIPVTLSEFTSGASKSRIYTDVKGTLYRTELGGQGAIQLQAKELALAPPAKKEDQPDQLILNSLHTTTPIEDASKLWQLKLRFQGEDLSKIPSDEFQTVTKDGDGWVVHIHPPVLGETQGEKIGESIAGKEEWLKPSPNISCDDPAIRVAAKKAVGEKAVVVDAALAIRQFVSKRMKGKMEFGEVRDAVDILKSPHGKCTEYAVLTTTLLRASGIPARIVSGLVTGDGTFFYHAWSEAWDGHRWIGVDAALEVDQLPAMYVKLAQGDTDSGFKIIYPDDPSQVKIDVLPIGH